MSAVQSKISSRMTAVESTSVMRQRQFATEEKSGDMLIVPLSRPDFPLSYISARTSTL